MDDAWDDTRTSGLAAKIYNHPRTRDEEKSCDQLTDPRAQLRYEFIDSWQLTCGWTSSKCKLRQWKRWGGWRAPLDRGLGPARLPSEFEADLNEEIHSPFQRFLEWWYVSTVLLSCDQSGDQIEQVSRDTGFWTFEFETFQLGWKRIGFQNQIVELGLFLGLGVFERLTFQGFCLSDKELCKLFLFERELLFLQVKKFC